MTPDASATSVTVSRKAYELVCIALGHISVGILNAKDYAAQALRQAAEIESTERTRTAARVEESSMSYEILQNDEWCAEADALSDALHFAAQYSKDGPVQMYRVTRERIDIPELDAKCGAHDGAEGLIDSLRGSLVRRISREISDIRGLGQMEIKTPPGGYGDGKTLTNTPTSAGNTAEAVAWPGSMDGLKPFSNSALVEEIERRVQCGKMTGYPILDPTHPAQDGAAGEVRISRESLRALFDAIRNTDEEGLSLHAPAMMEASRLLTDWDAAERVLAASRDDEEARG